MERDNNHSELSAKCHDVGVAVGIIIAKNGEVLMMQRTGSTGTGTWAIPGGGIEFGETPEEAAVRETREETGLKVNDLEFVGYTNDVHEERPLHYVTLRFFTNNIVGTPTITEPEKCTGMGWFSITNLPAPLFEPTARILSRKDVIKRISKS